MLELADWLKLSSEEKSGRYKELSDQDKFKVRQGHYYDLESKEKHSPESEFMKEINQMWEEVEKYENENNATNK